jgi:Amt family ammonium transporter
MNNRARIATMLRWSLPASAIMFLSIGTASAQDAGVGAETAFIFNSLSFLLHGFLVMWMAAGFCMLEAGLVRKRSVATQLLKNIALFSLAGIMFYLVGYNLMYAGVDGGYLGTFSIWGADDSAALAETGADFGAGYAAGSDWFFQMVFVATAASIVSGAMAERVRVWPFLAFIAVLTGFMYPITGAWQWGGGWLAEMGFSDFAGSTLVHSVGGWAALAGIMLLGSRKGKYTASGHPHQKKPKAKTRSAPRSKASVRHTWIKPVAMASA